MKSVFVEGKFAFSEEFKLSGPAWWSRALRRSFGLELRSILSTGFVLRWPFLVKGKVWGIVIQRLDGVDPLAEIYEEGTAVALFKEICSTVEEAIAEYDAYAAGLPPLEPAPADAG